MDLGAGGLGQLRGGDADAAGRGVDQHALAGAQRAVAEQARPRGRVVDGDRGALLEADRPSGSGIASRSRDDDLLGVAAEARPGHDARRRRAPASTPCADRGDRPRHLVADDGRQRRRVLVEPDARHRVGEVHARRADRDPHLPGPGGRDRAAPGPAGRTGSPVLVMTTARMAREPSRRLQASRRSTTTLAGGSRRARASASSRPRRRPVRRRWRGSRAWPGRAAAPR